MVKSTVLQTSQTRVHSTIMPTFGRNIYAQSYVTNEGKKGHRGQVSTSSRKATQQAGQGLNQSLLGSDRSLWLINHFMQFLNRKKFQFGAPEWLGWLNV